MGIGFVREDGNKQYWGDLSGKPLIPELVEKARLEELGEIAKHDVYEKVPLDECWKTTGQPPIGTRWVDVNKGDDQNPDYRSILVAQEIKLKLNPWITSEIRKMLKVRDRLFARKKREPDNE